MTIGCDMVLPKTLSQSFFLNETSYYVKSSNSKGSEAINNCNYKYWLSNLECEHFYYVERFSGMFQLQLWLVAVPGEFTSFTEWNCHTVFSSVTINVLFPLFVRSDTFICYLLKLHHLPNPINIFRAASNCKMCSLVVKNLKPYNIVKVFIVYAPDLSKVCGS